MTTTDLPEPGTDVAWIGLGSNIGARRQALDTMRDALGREGYAIQASPQIWTTAVGVTHQPDFLNQVLRVQAAQPLSAAAWLEACKRVQEFAGRQYTYRWGPRRADADLLLLGSDAAIRVGSAELTVPHPEIATRPFLCALLARIDPTLRHPDGWLFADRQGKFAIR